MYWNIKNTILLNKMEKRQHTGCNDDTIEINNRRV